MNQLSIFGYPMTPGYKDRDTSKAAAKAIASKAGTLREQCLEVLLSGSATADEVADALEESILSIRPRITELVRMGRIFDSGARRKNSSGKLAKVWRVIK